MKVGKNVSYLFKRIRRYKRAAAAVLTAAMLFSDGAVMSFAAQPVKSAAIEESTILSSVQECEETEITGEDGIVGGTASGNTVTEAVAPGEEECPHVLGADAETENSDGEEATDTIDERAIVTALSGAVCDSAVFSADNVLIKEKPAIKLVWNLKGCKYATIDRVNKDGTLTTISTRTTKKNFSDFTLYESDKYLPIYIARFYGKLGEEMGIYTTIPSSKITFSSTGTVVGTSRVVFTRSEMPVIYKLERAVKKKFNDIDDSFYVFDVEHAKNNKAYAARVSENKVRLRSADVLAPEECIVNARSSYSVVDASAGADNNKVNYYRVTAQLDIPGLEISAKPSNVEKVKTNLKYGAPTITRISKYASDTEGVDHDLCYDDGNFYVCFENGLPSGITTAETQILVYRAGLKGGYKKIAAEYITDLATALDGKSRVNYVIPYSSFDPEITYDYKAALSYKGIGGFSQPMERTCTFDAVNIIQASEKSHNSVLLKWYSDGCATKYNIYRSEDTWDSLDAAKEAMETLGKEHYKKLKAVKNTSFRSGTEMEYEDKKGLELGMYHIYRIIPANKKEADFFGKSKPLPIKAYPASPDTVFERPINLNSMDIVFSKAENATVYKIQRTDTSVGGEPVFEAEKGVDFKEYEFKAGKLKADKIKNDDGEEEQYLYFTQNVGDDGLVRGKNYYYRVVACCSVGSGAVMWADEESANYTEAHTQLAPVRDLNVTLTGKSSVDRSNVVKIAFKTSGNTGSQVDGVYDYTRVDHYEIVSASSVAGLDNATPMTIDGKNYSYATSSGTTTVDLHAHPDTEMSKSVRGVKRGNVYYFAVRTVYGKDKDKNQIKGKWTRVKFVLPVEVFIYPDKNSKNTSNSQTNRVGITADGNTSKNFYLDFDPYDSTYKEVTVSKTETTGEEVTTASSSSYFTLTYDSTLTENGYQYFTVKPAANTSTTVHYCTITVTVKNYGAAGDVTDQLVKKYYIKDIPQSSSSS